MSRKTDVVSLTKYNIVGLGKVYHVLTPHTCNHSTIVGRDSGDLSTRS